MRFKVGERARVVEFLDRVACSSQITRSTAIHIEDIPNGPFNDGFNERYMAYHAVAITPIKGIVHEQRFLVSADHLDPDRLAWEINATFRRREVELDA